MGRVLFLCPAFLQGGGPCLPKGQERVRDLRVGGWKWHWRSGLGAFALIGLSALSDKELPNVSRQKGIVCQAVLQALVQPVSSAAGFQHR